VNAIANPLGCYDLRRFDGDQSAMVAKIMEVFHPEGAVAAAPTGEEMRA
jgi:hypothetical protein